MILFLICLNKLRINIALLIFFSLLLVFWEKKNRLLIPIFTICIIWKSKFLFFIKIFFFGYFKTHLIVFYTGVLLVSGLHTINPLIWKIKNSTKMYIILLAFILGGRWALYLYNWGYYWTNDAIEYIMLFFLYVGLRKLHKQEFLSNYNLITIILPIYSLILLRLSFIFTKHNFFQQNKISYWMLKLILFLGTLQLTTLVIVKQNKFFTKLFNLQFLFFFIGNYFIWYNKINYISIQTVVYSITTPLAIFMYLNITSIKVWYILIQHSILIFFHVLLFYIASIYFIKNKYNTHTPALFNQFYNYYSYYRNYSIFTYQVNNLKNIKINNQIYKQQIATIILDKKFINFLG